MKSSLDNARTKQAAIEWLTRRGVSIEEIAELVMLLQGDYIEDLQMKECVRSVERVLAKREVQNALLTGIQLDMLAEERKLMSPLQEIIEHDEGLYGCDEILSLSITNVYGSIGMTNFGYIDKIKPGVLKRLNSKDDGQIHTFLDDIVGAIAAAASSRIAHSRY
jgi:phosphatidylglycerophosphatase A